MLPVVRRSAIQFPVLQTDVAHGQALQGHVGGVLEDRRELERTVSVLERIPSGLRGFDLPHVVFGRLAPENETFSGRFPGWPANPRMLNVRLPTIASMAGPYLDFTIGMLGRKSKLSIDTESAVRVSAHEPCNKQWRGGAAMTSNKFRLQLHGRHTSSKVHFADRPDSVASIWPCIWSRR